MSVTSLTYSISKEMLTGVVMGASFHMRAWSGGRRGSSTPGAAQATQASYDVFRKEDHSRGVHGGPIPPGLYICHYLEQHRRFGECVFLKQTLLALFQVDPNAQVRMYGRDDDFFIHGRGPHGSDGCIVPENESMRRKLNAAIKSCGTKVLLQVIDPGAPGRAGGARSPSIRT